MQHMNNKVVEEVIRTLIEIIEKEKGERKMATYEAGHCGEPDKPQRECYYIQLNNEIKKLDELKNKLVQLHDRILGTKSSHDPEQVEEL